MHIQHSHIVLDACCVLNFCASEKLLEILKAIPAQVVVTEVVRQQELKTLQRLKGEANEGVIQFETAIEQGLLTVLDFESEVEEETFVNYAFELGDDGESATGAIAVHRGWAIAIDDKKAISFFKKMAPDLQILSTLEIVKYWSEQENLDSAKLKMALNSIRVKGRYIPHKTHPLLDWWNNAMS
jgi:predicted nucleic acid-binding protein